MTNKRGKSFDKRSQLPIVYGRSADIMVRWSGNDSSFNDPFSRHTHTSFMVDIKNDRLPLYEWREILVKKSWPSEFPLVDIYYKKRSWLVFPTFRSAIFFLTFFGFFKNVFSQKSINFPLENVANRILRGFFSLTFYFILLIIKN